MDRRLTGWILFGFLCLAVAVRVIGIGHYPHLIYDEYYYVPAASLLDGHRFMSLPNLTAPLFIDPNLASHPPFAKELIALAIRLGGIHPGVWRLPGALLGASVVLPVYWLALDLFGSPRAALFAAGLESVEGLGVSLSHIFLLDSIADPLVVWNLWLVWRLCRALGNDSRISWVFLISTGILLGLGLSAKWTGGQTLVVAAIALAAAAWYHRHRWTGWIWGKMTVTVVVLPFFTYVATYLYALPKGFQKTWLANNFLLGFFQLQWAMLHNMWNLQFFHPGTAPARSWIGLPRPVILLDWMHQGHQTLIMTLPDPLVVWAGIAAFLVLGVFWRHFAVRPGSYGFLLLWFLVFYPMWFLTPRSKFLYYFLPAMIPLILTLAYALTRLWRGSWGWSGRVAGLILGVGLSLSALVLLPMTAGFAMPPQYQQRVWLPEWTPLPSPSPSINLPSS